MRRGLEFSRSRCEIDAELAADHRRPPGLEAGGLTRAQQGPHLIAYQLILDLRRRNTAALMVSGPSWVASGVAIGPVSRRLTMVSRGNLGSPCGHQANTVLPVCFRFLEIP